MIADTIQEPSSVPMKKRVDEGGNASSVFLDENNTTVSARKPNKDLDSARRIVASILEQITLNDSPPNNEFIISPDDSKVRSHIRPLTDRNGNHETENSNVRKYLGKNSASSFSKAPHHSFDISETSSDSSIYPRGHEMATKWLDQCMHREERAEMKLGHRSLAILCHQTLKATGELEEEYNGISIQERVSSSASKTDESPNNLRKPISTEATNVLHENTSNIINLESEGNILDEKLLATLSSENDSDDEMHAVSTTITTIDQTENSALRYMQGQKHIQAFKSGTCLKMYGSEYARFLSNTVFAPHNKNALLNSRKKPNKHSSMQGKLKSHVMHEGPNAMSTGAITDIVITRGDTLPPKGYYRISQTRHGKELREIWPWGGNIFVKREPNWDRAAQRPCVTAVALIFPDRNEVVPPGFCVVSKYENSTAGIKPSKKYKQGMNDVANLGYGLNRERIYLCYRRSREGNPITGLMALFPSLSDPIPEGYTVLEKSPRNHVANLNPGGAYPVFLALRQRLASLETLYPLPLLLSVQRDSLNDSSSLRNQSLGSYYCTGGSTVTSQVGCLHIMDRSTHSLLSPSSIQTRISVIQAARLKGESDGSTVSSIGMLGVVSSKDSPSFLDEALTDEGSTINESVLLGNCGDDTSENDPNFLFRPSTRKKSDRKTFFTRKDSALDYCSSTLSFIPMVETPLTKNDETKLESRIAIITPILTACYTQHGGAALTAVEGLNSLFRHTDFFHQDIALTAHDEGCHCRITLLDLAIQSVCDIATSTARETSFLPCIDFVKAAMKYSKCNLNTRTIGFVLRFYLFIFYFGASLPTSSTAANTVWTDTSSFKQESRSEIASDDVPLLVENDGTSFVGGAPQAAALALKELATLLMQRMSTIKADLHERSVLLDVAEDPLGNFIEETVSSIVDNAMRRVDLANNTQLAMHQIRRSGGSELFWYDMLTTCGSGLFRGVNGLPLQEKAVCIIGFSFLANVVKAASGKLRQIPRTCEFIPRDVANKLLSLELLCHCLDSFGVSVQKEKIFEIKKAPSYQKESIETLLYSIRRLVVQCLLGNTTVGLKDSRIFRRVLRVISELWKKPVFRLRMKLELGVLMEHFILRLVRLGPQLVPPNKIENLKTSSVQFDQEVNSFLCTFPKPLFNHQIDALFEVSQWFHKDARALIELFLNFDTNISFANEGQKEFTSRNQWNICNQLCESICIITEQCSEEIVEQIKVSQVRNEGPLTPTSTTSQTPFFSASRKDNDSEVHTKEKENEKVSIRLAARRLQRASFTAVCNISKSLTLASAASAGKEEELIVSEKFNSNKLDFLEQDDPNNNDNAEIAPRLGRLDNKSAGILSHWQTLINNERGEGNPEVKKTQSNQKRQSEKDPSTGMKVSKSTAITSDKILEIALNFAKTKSLKSAIAYLVKENYMSPAPRDVAAFLRINHNQLNTVSLGGLIGEGGINDNEEEYWNLVRFNYVRAISFVGLTVEEGLRHFLTNCGFKLPGEAQQIDRIITTFSQCYWEDNASDHYICPFEDQDTIFLLSFAIIMLNTDLHKVSRPRNTRSKVGRLPKKMTKLEFINNLRGVAKNGELDKEYISGIYDSVASNPIQLFEGHVSPVTEVAHIIAFSDITECNLGEKLKLMTKNVKKSEELLRGLAVHNFRFYTMEDYARHKSCATKDTLCDVSKRVFVSTWHYFHNLIKATIKNAQLDPEALVLSLDLLSSSLCTALCLEMKKEFNSFLHLLARVKMFAEKTNTVEAIEVQDWFNDLQVVMEKEDRVPGLEQILEITHELKKSLQTENVARKQITRIVRLIQDGQFLLEDPTRFFVRDGEIMKRSHMMSRNMKYIFFLFSDILLYAKPISASSEKFAISEVLSLHLMTIVDWYPNSNRNNSKNFTIHHPRKSFVVLCKTVEERKSWVAALRVQIDESRLRASAITTKQATCR